MEVDEAMVQVEDMQTLPILLPSDRIAEFCQRWRIQEFALFGSVLRDDFRPDSDIDVGIIATCRRKLGL